MLQKLLRTTGIAALFAAAALVAPSVQAQADPQATIAASETSLSNFLRDPEMKWLQQNLHRAKAVMIAPEIVKAGFIFGGSGGRGARDGARSEERQVGRPGVLHAGARRASASRPASQVSEGLTLVMTDKGFNSLLATSFKMGGDASVAAGPVGAGAKSDVVADLITFSRAKGVYGGLNLDGTVVTAADDWNASFYGKKVLPPDILVRANVHNKAADKLLAAIAAATKK